MIKKIISGGQTGADRAALDWAIRNRVPHGGFCPRGRKAEDGAIPEHYQLTELETAAYVRRTERNVQTADGTLIVTCTPKLSRGTGRTAELCKLHSKPMLHIQAATPDPGVWLRAFVEQHSIAILNVAGPRASSAPTVARLVGRILDEAFPGARPRNGSRRAGRLSEGQPNAVQKLFAIASTISSLDDLFVEQLREALEGCESKQVQKVISKCRSILDAAEFERFSGIQRVTKVPRERVIRRPTPGERGSGSSRLETCGGTAGRLKHGVDPAALAGFLLDSLTADEDCMRHLLKRRRRY
jgi:hypothetical protein